LIRELAEKMRFVSYFLSLGILVAIFGLVLIARGGLANIIQGIVQIIIGFWTKQPLLSSRLTTQGNDIENLMGALGELRKLYTLQYWLYIVALILWH